MVIHLGPTLQQDSCGLPPRRASLETLGRATRKAGRLALLRVEIAAFHLTSAAVISPVKQEEIMQGLLVSVALILTRDWTSQREVTEATGRLAVSEIRCPVELGLSSPPGVEAPGRATIQPVRRVLSKNSLRIQQGLWSLSGRCHTGLDGLARQAIRLPVLLARDMLNGAPLEMTGQVPG